MLENAEEYFTELVLPNQWMTLYQMSLTLPEVDLSTLPKPKLAIDFKMGVEKQHFYFAVHPPHHMRYGRRALEGLTRIYVPMDQVQPGETNFVSYTFKLTKKTRRAMCSKSASSFDACQIRFMEKRLGCKLLWIRGKQIGQSSYEKYAPKKL